MDGEVILGPKGGPPTVILLSSVTSPALSQRGVSDLRTFAGCRGL